MANHKSAEKSIRKNAKRAMENRSRKTRIKTFIKKVEEAIISGNKENAVELFKIVEPELMIGVNKGVFKLNTAARKISRLSQKVKNMNI